MGIMLEQKTSGEGHRQRAIISLPRCSVQQYTAVSCIAIGKSTPRITQPSCLHWQGIHQAEILMFSETSPGALSAVWSSETEADGKGREVK